MVEVSAIVVGLVSPVIVAKSQEAAVTSPFIVQVPEPINRVLAAVPEKPNSFSVGL
jgi:hypothetical protein